MSTEKYHRPPYRFCPWCAAPLPRETPWRQECSACGFVLYHHSNPCVGGIPLDDNGRVLLGRRGVDPFRGDWNVIGGFLQYGEDPLAGLKREVREELGVDCAVGDFLVAAADWYGPQGVALLNLYFRVKLAGADLKAQDDVTELRWFPLDDLPENLAFASDRTALRTLQSVVRKAGPHEAAAAAGDRR